VHGPAYVLLAPAARAAELWSALCDSGAAGLDGGDGSAAASVAMGGEEEWQALRIACGRPFPDSELTRDVNPLEAGLYHAISFAKGCYLGQETVSKVNAAPAPKQRLFGLELDKPLPVGAPLFANGGQRAGVVTSMLPGGRGLAMIRSAVGVAGLQVTGADAGGATPGAAQPGAVSGQVVDIPFPSRSEAQSAHPRGQVVSGMASAADRAADKQAIAAAAAAAEAEARRKAEKLAAMEARFAAFKAKAAASKSAGGAGEEAGG
jgi:folate-binding protein YgfZ